MMVIRNLAAAVLTVLRPALTFVLTFLAVERPLAQDSVARYGNAVKILALGNSITNGTSVYNSYRRSLWKMLGAAGYRVDFIGSWNKHHMGGQVPNPDFDMDHEGHSGWTAHDVFQPPSWDSARGNIHSWLRLYTPDMVLVELGANDIFQCRPLADVIKDFDSMIDLFRSVNRRVKIFIANVMPFGAQWADKKLCGNAYSYEASIQSLNTALDSLAGKKDRRRAPVKLVNQYSGIDPARHMYDDIHPNESGENIMAGKFYEAIIPYIKKYKRP